MSDSRTARIENPPVEVQCGFPMCGKYSGDSRFCMIHEPMIREWAQWYVSNARKEAFDKAAAIVRGNMWSDSGSTLYSREANIHLEDIACELESESERC